MTDTRVKARTPLWKEVPILVVVALGLAFGLKTFVVQAFSIPSASMEKTLLVGDRVLVDKLVYDFRGPRRGEVVVFRGKGNGFQGAADGNSGDDFVKRVAAVGGDTVSCPPLPEDPGACRALVVDGRAVDESAYLFEDGDQQSFAPMTVPRGDLFVLGDHRDDSADSRVHGFVPVGAVIGRAFVRVWPLDRIGGISMQPGRHPRSSQQV